MGLIVMNFMLPEFESLTLCWTFFRGGRSTKMIIERQLRNARQRNN